MKLYHGTARAFQAIDLGVCELGLHLAADPLLAVGRLAETAKRHEFLPAGSRVLEVEAEFDHVLALKGDAHNWSEVRDVLPLLPPALAAGCKAATGPELRAHLLEHGYDAIRYENDCEEAVECDPRAAGRLFGARNESQRCWVALDASKLVLGREFAQAELESHLDGGGPEL